MFKITTSMVVTLVLLLSSCSTSYNSFIGTHQEKPFEVQVNSSFDEVWATIEKFISDEEMPIYWKDKSGGVITTDPISFLKSYTYENAEGMLLDPSSRVVISGDETTKPNQIDGKWRFRVQSKDDDVSVISIELQYPKATSMDNGSKTSLFVRSTGTFEKMIYAMLIGKDMNELEKPAPTPVTPEIKEEVTPLTAVEKDATQVEEAPMAKESPISDIPEVKKPTAEKPASLPASVDISMTDTKPQAAQESATMTSEEEPNALSGSIVVLKNQIENQENIIKEQRKEIEELKNQQRSAPTANSQNQMADANSLQIADHISEQFTVQFIALSESDRQFNEINDLGQLVVEKVPNKNVYRYKIGHFDNKLDAIRALTQIRQRGFRDAFIN